MRICVHLWLKPPTKKEKGAFVSEDALHFDGDKPNSVSLISQTGRSFISSRFHGTPVNRNAQIGTAPADVMRLTRGCSRITPGLRTGCPSSVLPCTAWGFSCLADYSASGELLPRLFNLTCASLPKNRRCFFCDTVRHHRFATITPAPFARHAAVWCSDFPPASLAAHQRSSAIGD